MPFLDWVNKNQAKETTREVPYHLLKQESVHGDVTGNSGSIPATGGACSCLLCSATMQAETCFSKSRGSYLNK